MSIQTPDWVRFETPQGERRVGEVVDAETGPAPLPNSLIYIVRYDGIRFRVRAPEADPVTPIV